MRLFAQAYPNEVVGLILVDPSNEHDEEWNDPIYRQKMVQALRAERIPAAIGLYRLLARFAWTHIKPGAPAIMLNYAPFLVNPQSIQASAQEIENWPIPGCFSNWSTGGYPLGDLPLVVLTATKASTGVEHAKVDKWIARHAELAKLSTRGKQVLVESGHHILHEQPTLVIHTIREMVIQARAMIAETTG